LRQGRGGEYLELREEVAGGCRRLHNEKLLNLYASSDIIS